ncbi:hypothetical protein [Corynebacterium phoceense]|uniref:hypothetical protein n=1 Tax=Corynebacterium phoceense TaxID=1686286 RepID=UPI00211B9523|nr:hypothetical protein [Corynebacterium phoceense]MCQ9345032.1 hypothetical protein [Corynebacterium phoceense]
MIYFTDNAPQHLSTLRSHHFTPHFPTTGGPHTSRALATATARWSSAISQAEAARGAHLDALERLLTDIRVGDEALAARLGGLP